MYDAIAASHYSAYRPPLHVPILERALRRDKPRQFGLDIGCGTGCSVRGLAGFCNYVVGLEPSRAMLLETSRRDRESFVNAAGERLPIANQSVDLVTLAGSLNYIERDPLVEELSRISREGAEVVVYDFDIDLSDCEDFLGIDTRVEPGSYDHSVNLSDYEELTEVSVVEDEHSIDLSHEEISHLLLSDRGRYDALRRKFAVSNPEESVREELRLTRRAGSVRSRIFYSVYSMESVCGGRGQERGKG